ncbi:MAG: Holliday junction branch migration protein RuvA [Candidatus Wildermuthbacteria bacterium]|nr:Holliday junction branch migration protein RuvA [Candidatus Wildermuthbacteria bacterium]
MISYLQGKVIFKGKDWLVVNVQGVGYKVFASEPTIEKTSVGQAIELFCFLNVGEGVLDLYGFLSQEALSLFETLNDVQGIGPKAALALSSLGTIEHFKKAIEARDERFFSGIKGIGQKKMQKIMLELTGKLGDPLARRGGAKDEAVEALVGLGFQKRDAENALSRVSSDITAEERIKEALKLLGGN